MVGYFNYEGLNIQYPLSGGRTGFIIQSALEVNFDTTPVIANASYFRDAPIWGHTELHLTRAWIVYTFNAANTKVALFATTGPDPTKFLSIPLICCAISSAGIISKAFTTETGLDIPLEPAGVDGSTSEVNFLMLTVSGVNASDDVGLIFQGWYRDDVPEHEETASITETTDRGLLESIYDLLTGKE